MEGEIEEKKNEKEEKEEEEAEGRGGRRRRKRRSCLDEETIRFLISLGCFCFLGGAPVLSLLHLT